MFNKKIFITSLIFFGLLGSVFSTQAMLVSQVNFINFRMEKASFTAGEEIKGDFTLKNYEKELVPDITYSYRLLAEDSQGFYTIILDEKFSGDNFSLRPDQKITKSFSYRLPQNLPSGNHKFSVQLFNSKGISMSRKDSDVVIQSDNKFLTLENNFLLGNGQKFLPKGEAVYDAGQIPRITFDISNKSSFQISAFPKIAFYYYDIAEKPFRVIEKESITLEPGETQGKTFDLVDFKEPGIYLCRLTLYENNNTISNSIDFRWTIPGKDIEVMQFRIDRSSYEEGEDALVVVFVANIADLPTEEKGKLQVTIYDKDDKIVGEKTEEISLEGGRIEVKVPITKNVENPRVEIMVINDDQEILDNYQAQTRDDEITGKAIKKELPREKGNILLIIGILVVIVAFIVYFLKKRSSAANAIFMILVFSGIFLLANSALAAYVHPDSTANISWDLPLPDYFHEAGGYVQFQGTIFLSGGDNLDNSEIEFFISGPEDVVLKEEGEIWVIDEDPGANPGLIKLGTSAYPGPVDELYYDDVFEIPEGVSYIGEEAARFYVQFKGRRGATWEWAIAYEKATIQAEGEGGLYIDLEPNKTEALVGEEINWKVTAGNNLPCMQHETDVMLVLDISDTMADDGKLDDAKIAAKTFADRMNPAYNRLGLASYSNDAYLNAALTFDYPSLKEAIEDLDTINMTCISCGINIANREMIDNGRPETALYHIFLTDGLANYCIEDDSGDIVTGWSCGFGDPSENDARAQATLSKEADITIYTIGFMVPGSAVDLMEDVADITGGKYFNANDAAELKEAYTTIAGLISGDSIMTRIEIDIPDNLEVTGYDASCEIVGNKLICPGEGGWDLLCGGESGEMSFTFTTKVVSGEVGQAIEIKATVKNISGKQKTDTETVEIVSQPTAEIISPDAGPWLRGDFEASFKYTDDAEGPGLAVCEYRVESKPGSVEGWFIEPWTGATKSQWGNGNVITRDPYNTSRRESRAQFIILKSELNALGFSGGAITGFYLQDAQLPGKPSLANFRIRLKHTAKTTITTWEGDWANCFGPEAILQGDLTPGEWKEYICATPFIWNGTDNLMVDISRNDTGSVINGGMYRREIASADRMVAGMCDGCALYDLTAGIGGNLEEYNFVPAIRINAETDEHITVPWTSADNCSNQQEVILVKNITVGEGKDCRHQGEGVCRISVRAIDLWDSESKKAGEWQRIYNIDWTPPEIEIK